MICDTLDQLHLYKGFHKNLDTAIEFLAAHPLDTLPLGRTEVDGDEVFINVMDADLKPHTGSHAEYHRLYADLQIDLTGGEGWGYETAPGTEVEPYQPDIGKKDSEDAVFGALGEGRFVLFFPGELHRPGVEMPGCDRSWSASCRHWKEREEGGLTTVPQLSGAIYGHYLVHP
jgi:YhcH/YjgK/YiaL family protein